MKKRINNVSMISMLIILGILPVMLMAQQPKVNNVRAYDQTGINKFEEPKDDTVKYDGLKLKFGAAITQQFQNLKDENSGALNNNVGSFSAGTKGNKLIPISAGFQTAEANLYLDVQLYDGIRLNVTSYLSSKHHNETWVKGGYFLFDKLPFKGKVWDDIMKVTTIKVGEFEVNYGDEHFRRSDGGEAIYNPFMEGDIMDEFATEIGTEIYVKKNGLFGMFGITSGMLKGNVDSLVATPADANVHKSPSILLKAGFDRKLADNVRLRLSASYYGNQSCGSNTLFGGDRTGSNYQFVMEENANNQSSTTGAGTGLAFSGRLNPGFSKKINAGMFNAFLKVGGFEFLGMAEASAGRTAAETSTRNANQYALEAVYRFGRTENLFIGARYNSVSAQLANSAAGTGAGAISYNGNYITVNRTAFAAGWFLTKNVLVKGEYVNQVYNDFPSADYRSTGKFDGYVLEAVVSF